MKQNDADSPRERQARPQAGLFTSGDQFASNPKPAVMLDAYNAQAALARELREDIAR